MAAPTLMAMADIAYRSGCWLAFVEFAHAAAIAHHVFEAAPTDLEEHTDLQRLLVHLAIARRWSDSFNPAAVTDWLDARLKHCRLDDIVAELLEDGDPWQGHSREDLVRRACSEIGNPPFFDAGPERNVRFTALGLTFTIRFPTDYATSLAAERFIAILQVVIADLAKRDLGLLRTTVDISVELAHESLPTVESMPSNRGRIWTVRLTPFTGSDRPSVTDATIETLSAVVAVLREASLLVWAIAKFEQS